jgi:hypothetical protein
MDQFGSAMRGVARSAVVISARPVVTASAWAATLPPGDRRVRATLASDGGCRAAAGAPVASSLRYQQRTQAVRRLAPKAPLKLWRKFSQFGGGTCSSVGFLKANPAPAT